MFRFFRRRHRILPKSTIQPMSNESMASPLSSRLINLNVVNTTASVDSLMKFFFAR